MNNQRIAAECAVELPLHQRLLPHYPLPAEESAADYLRKICFERLPQRVAHVTSAYEQRLDYELSVIHKMGFDDYFLIIWDVMDFAHQQEIVTGAGRGSAAGALVAYVLSITDVDPIKYDLLFERFLNPERYTMPDIDLDIPDNRRDEILQYVRQNTGKNIWHRLRRLAPWRPKWFCEMFLVSLVFRKVKPIAGQKPSPMP